MASLRSAWLGIRKWLFVFVLGASAVVISNLVFEILQKLPPPLDQVCLGAFTWLIGVLFLLVLYSFLKGSGIGSILLFLVAVIIVLPPLSYLGNESTRTYERLGYVLPSGIILAGFILYHLGSWLKKNLILPGQTMTIADVLAARKASEQTKL